LAQPGDSPRCPREAGGCGAEREIQAQLRPLGVPTLAKLHHEAPQEHAVSQLFAAAVESAGVPRVTFHELRHSFGTIAARSGVDVRTLPDWLGHTELATTMVYLRYASQPGASAMLGKAFATVVPTPVGHDQPKMPPSI
jgi:integrase